MKDSKTQRPSAADPTEGENADAGQGGRRSVLTGLAAIACSCQALHWLPTRAEADDQTGTEASNLPPQIGDRFTYIYGDKVGETIKPDDLPLGRDQKLVYPIDLKTGTVRDGSRLNMMLLVRLDPEALDAETRPNAAEGVVAYSAVCTHHGCPVSMWSSKAKTLYCSCHGTEYDPTAAAKVVAGPAPRRLPMMPVAIEDGEIVVAGEFTSRVGSQNS